MSEIKKPDFQYLSTDTKRWSETLKCWMYQAEMRGKTVWVTLPKEGELGQIYFSSKGDLP